MKYVILWFRMFYGIHLLFSAGRHYMTDWQAQIPGPGGRFVDSIMEIGLYEMVKGIEGIVGLCLVLNLFVPLVLVVELPISFIIFWLNFVIVAEGYQLFTGPQEIILNLLLIVFYGGYYTSMLTRSATPKPLWQHLPWKEQP